MPAWSELPKDLLDMFYRGYITSPYDHAHFTAVCVSWHAITSWHPMLPALLPLPWIGDAERDREA